LYYYNPNYFKHSLIDLVDILNLPISKSYISRLYLLTIFSKFFLDILQSSLHVSFNNHLLKFFIGLYLFILFLPISPFAVEFTFSNYNSLYFLLLPHVKQDNSDVFGLIFIFNPQHYLNSIANGTMFKLNCLYY